MTVSELIKELKMRPGDENVFAFFNCYRDGKNNDLFPIEYTMYVDTAGVILTNIDRKEDAATSRA